MPMNSPESTISCSGFCARCNREHVLYQGQAHNACLELMQALREKRRIDLNVSDAKADPRFSTDILFGEGRGHMFGAMVYRDAEGQTGTLRAFSGQYNGVWDVDGWAPPLVDVAEFERINMPGERAIKAMGRRMDAFESVSPEYGALRRERRKMSQALMQDLFNLYRLSNFAGETRSLAEVFPGKGIPTGTGECCAPKLLGCAVRNGWVPLGIAEFYWGRENRSGTRQHGVFYPACEEKCRPILGFMLCGLDD